MKYLIVLLTALSFNVFSNPEVSNDGPVHFVLNKNNADQEYKTDAGQCVGGVYPNGDGTEWGEIICYSTSYTLPWYTVPGIEEATQVNISSNEMTGTPCEMFDSSNNAGNNQGHNVTQYNSNNWFAMYKATRDIDGLWNVVYHQRCDNGIQQ